MAAKTLDQWMDENDSALRAGFNEYESCWNAATKAAEAQAASTNKDYAAALNAYFEYQSTFSEHPLASFENWCIERLNAAKAQHCA